MHTNSRKTFSIVIVTQQHAVRRLRCSGSNGFLHAEAVEGWYGKGISSSV